MSKLVVRKNEIAPKPIRAVLFDLGKVILDFDFMPAFERLARACKLRPAQIDAYFRRSGLEVLYDGGRITSLGFYRQVKTDLRLCWDYEEFRAIWNDIFTANKEVCGLIRRLRSNYRLVLISNTNAMHFEHIRSKYRVLDHFDRFVLSFREKVRKPDPRIYQLATRACQAVPKEIFYIDDREDLTEAAEALGFHCFTFRRRMAPLLEKMRKLEIKI